MLNLERLTSCVVEDNTLLAKIKEAVMQKHQQHAALQKLEAALPPRRVSQWTAEVKAWEANQEVLNPYCHK